MLKKLNLDRHTLKYVRPVSDIAFLSKLIDNVVANRLHANRNAYELNKKFKSIDEITIRGRLKLKYTAIYLRLSETKSGVVQMMLDLSASFVTINNKVLVKLFRKRIGVERNALK